MLGWYGSLGLVQTCGFCACRGACSCARSSDTVRFLCTSGIRLLPWIVKPVSLCCASLFGPTVL